MTWQNVVSLYNIWCSFYVDVIRVRYFGVDLTFYRLSRKTANGTPGKRSGDEKNGFKGVSYKVDDRYLIHYPNKEGFGYI